MAPAWRSLIVPGWGQGYNGQTTKGLVLGALTYGLLAAEIGTYVAGSSARNEYLSSNSPSANYDGMYSNWENMANMNHIFSIGMSVAYTFTLADAIFGAKSSSARAMTPSPVQLSFDSKGAQIRAKLLEF